jgi:hypothetical protein
MFLKKLFGYSKPNYSPAYLKYENSEFIQELAKKISSCKQLLPKNESFMGATKVNDFGIKILDQALEAVQLGWKEENFEAYFQNIKNGQLPEGYIYNFLTHQSANILEASGAGIYPGLLSEVGESLLPLFEHSIERSIQLNIYTREWADKSLRAPVYKNIDYVR